ncbi:hypothetical protein MJO28_015536 [Puccinia striiformis f. sp. tritici]|uniref:Uncharacterized protein n=1 Tax=Puccinia striiformis f. sp. tritici TaxID=168172 RepID=A0ACC0DPL6_9BASI|nr:hypothetical protein Pst134EA_029445 [Puccinia striiformis f. sp. tritici]KAH9447406.1 hypothetical protein Pst134EA_029445 [Puccinia striiformis f. sp. tritici]KAI7936527.1 hypothetical protein MJO29_015830 [Puccinia striiformis f. sp. tritici]KAI7936637.1 hypothetical protein MJO28_015536 [Puccinia striiformis f. sp. tritici]KAI9624372.1 hypothetical protein KEM48_008955 [Puccinia striiformis f. sp. tritici PST-130]
MAPKSIPTARTKEKNNKTTTKQLLKQIKEHEQLIKNSQNQDLNPIADLLESLSQQAGLSPEINSQVTHALIYTLHRIFSSLIRQGRIHGSPVSQTEETEQHAVKLVKEWLKTQYSQYIDHLLSLLLTTYQQDGGGYQIELDCLTILMNLIRSESDLIRTLKHKVDNVKYPTSGFESSTFLKLVKTLLVPTSSITVPISVRSEFILRYLNFCDDIRFRFLKDATFLCQSFNTESGQQSRQKKKKIQKPKTGTRESKEGETEERKEQKKGLTQNLLIYLESITTMPTKVEELNQFWTGKPTGISSQGEVSSGTKRKKSIENERASKKKKKSKLVNEDGSTGIFDDDLTDSNEDNSALSSEEDTQKQNKTLIHPLLSLRAHQKAFSDAWISFLSIQNLSETEIKRVLKILHDQVIPHMIDPKILLDFLVDSIDFGGSISVLSLNALFTLMSKHNLDYPDFYTRLYALIDPSILHTRHRPRFFRMLEVFLSSTHLPVNIIASFIKKIGRLSLYGPPGAIITVVPFCYNLIKLHPTLMALLHRLPSDSSKSGGTLKALEINDPFKLDEPDPLKTEAIFSSAWEFVGLRSHYLASISTLFKVFQESFDKPNYELEDFLDHTYSSLIETELTRIVKKPPALSLFALSYKEPPPSSSTSTSKKDNVKKLVVNDVVDQIWKI